MKHRIIPAIMSGGSGTRLWPVSTDEKPKQFHALAGAETLFVETLRRVQGESGALSFAPPVIICNARHAALVAEQAAAAGAAPAAIVCEPKGRNTAAAAAIAAALGAELDGDALVLLLPADHVVTDRAAFLSAVERAAPLARDRILTFGITPDRPATGYGYIKSGAELAPGVFAIDAFREKPEAAVAEEYLRDGGYSWNAGIFLFHPRVLLEEFAAAPAIRDGAVDALRKATRRGAEIHLDAAAFAATPSAPLDTAVMEKTARGAVAPCDIGWADLGAWDEIWRLAPQDGAGNAAHGPVAAIDASGNFLRSDGPKICIAGVSDLIVIATKDSVIVLPRARAQDVKALKQAADDLG